MGKCVRWDIFGLCFCFTAMMTIGCAGESGTPAGSGAGAAAVVPEELPGGDMPSVEEATELARQIEASFAAGDQSVFRSAVDWELMLDRVTDEIDVPEKYINGFRVGFMKSVSAKGGLPAKMLRIVRPGVRCRLLRVREKTGEMRALFRLVGPSGGVNYLDLLMELDKDEQVRIADYYLMNSADDISTTIRRSYVSFLVQQDDSLVEKLSENDAAHIKHVEDIGALLLHVKAQRAQEAMNVYRSLPPVLQSDTMVLFMVCTAARTSGSAEEQNRAANDFRRHHPNEPYVDLLMFEIYERNGEIDRALKCVDRVDDSVGGDPYLNMLRAACHISANRVEAAKHALRAVIEAEPKMDDVYWALLDLALDTKDFAEVTRVLQGITSEFNAEFDDLTTVPEYAEYVKSPEYQEWLESRAQNNLESDALVQ